MCACVSALFTVITSETELFMFELELINCEGLL